nr:MAG: polyprotein [Canine picornavirus]
MFCIDCESEQCTCGVQAVANEVQFDAICAQIMNCINQLSDLDLDPVEPMEVDIVMESQGATNSKGQAQNQSNGNFGTVINNYYQNSYQGSIDMSGVSAGGKPASTAQGLVDSAASAFSAVAPMLLDQNTEEMTDLADRVMTQTQGNSTVNTQSTVGRMIGYGVRSHSGHPTSCGDNPTEGQPATDRFYTFRIASWTTTQEPYSYIELPLPGIFFQQERGGVFAQNMLRHYSLKCGWRAQIQCNASHFHSGSLLVFFAPEYVTLYREAFTWQTVDRAYNLRATYNNYLVDSGKTCDLGYTCPEQWTLFPHQILNLRTGTSVDIEVPYANVTPTSDPTVHNPWTLVIAVLSPLAYSAGASPEIEITVSIAPVNPVWNGLRQVSQGPFPVVPRENSDQFTSTLPDFTTPIYGLVQNRSTDYLPGEFTDLVSLAKVPCFMSLTSDDAVVPYFEVGNSIPTTPNLTFNVVMSCRCLTNTMVGTMSRNFAQYRGSLNYNFVFTGTAMMKLKVLIAYTPPGAGVPESLEQAMQGTYAIWDIGLNSTWVFTVPFISVSDWRFTLQSSANALNADGWVTVWQLTPLTFPPGNPTTAKILVMASAGEDFSFRNPIFSGTVVSQGVDNAEKGEVAKQDASDDQEGSALDVNPSHTQVNFFYDRSRVLGFLKPNAYQLLDPSVNLFDANGVMRLSGASSAHSYLRTGHVTGQRIMRLGPHPSIGIYPLTIFAPPFNWDRTFWNLAPFTYFRADLEVTVTPYADTVPEGTKWNVLWTPCGAPVTDPAPTFSWQGTGAAAPNFEAIGNFPQNALSFNPIASSMGGKAVSFQIPWNSPQTVCSTQYRGFASYANRPGEFGYAPANYWGWLQITTSTAADQRDLVFLVYIRYKNMRTWMPRPVFSRPLPQASRQRYPGLEMPRPTDVAAANRVLESQGCVSFNPQIKHLPFKLRVKDRPPVAFFTCRGRVCAMLTLKHTQHVVRDVSVTHPLLDNWHVSKVYHDWIQQEMMSQGAGMSTEKEDELPDDAAMACLLKALEADTSIETLSEGWSAIKALKKEWMKLKETVQDHHFWGKVVTGIIKIMVTTYAMFQCNTAGKAALAALAMLTAAEWTGLVDMLTEYLATVLSTPPPSPPIFDVSTVSYQVKQKEEKKKKLASQGPGDSGLVKTLQNLNCGFNVAKSVDWAITKLKEIINWLKSWFSQEERTPKARLEEMITGLPMWISEVHNYREGKTPQISKETIESINQCYELAIQTKLTGLANFLERFRSVTTHTTARMEPVVVVLRGKPGRGKSIAAQLIAQAISKVMTGHQSVYSFPPDSKYFDGYSGQYAMIMDDLGQNPDGEDFKVFCQMVSTTHFVPNMASLDQKGTSFQTQVIIATTNQPSFRPVTVADPGAVARRVTFDYDVAPDGCIAVDGKLDIDQALTEVHDGAGPRAPFRFHCPLLDHLKFMDSQKQTHTLPEVVDLIACRLTHKKHCANRLNMLVSQGLTVKVDDPVLEQTLDNLNKYIEVLEQHRDSVARVRSDFFAVAKIVLGFCAALAGAYAIKKLIGSSEPEKPSLVMTPKMVVVENSSEGSSAYDGKSKKMAKKELAVLNLENGNPQMDFELFCAQKVVFQIQFVSGDCTEQQSAIAICDRIFVTNAHSFRSDWDAFTINGMSFKRDLGYEVFEIHKKGVSTDLVFVKLSAGPYFKNNVSKFCEGAPKRGTEVTGVAHFAEVPLFYEGQVISDISPVSTTTGVYANMFRYSARTRKGYCGSAVVGMEGNAKRIYGMHSAGIEGIAGACLLQRSMIQRVLKHFGIEPKMESQGLVKEQQPGPYVHVSRRTQLRKTLAHEVFQPEFAPAALSKYDSRLNEGVDLDDVIFSKHKSNQSELPPVANTMAKEYANLVFSQIGKENGRISVTDAILGMDGLESMEKNTSPGLPYTLKHQRRTDLMDFELGEIVDDGLRKEIQLMHQGWFDDHCFQTFLKDEIRPLEKVKAGKTRIVDVASVGHCIVGRQLLGRFASKFQTRPGFEIGSAIGCNPETDWTKFYWKAKEYKYVYDVDYSAFDASHGTAVFEVLKQEFFNTANGFDPLVWKYLDSLAVSNHAYEERRFTLVGGLPSGCSSTSVLNTVINNIVIRTGLAQVYKNFDFYDVAVLAYGDDLLLASNYKLDLKLLKERMAPMGYVITPATKDADFPDEMQIEEAQFLKRRFVPDSSRPFLIKPVMEKKNLEAMLSFYRPGTMTERLESIVQLATHSGPDIYDWLFRPYRDRGYVIPEWTTAYRRWHSLFE